jgi:hypothetical protein
MIQEFYFSHLRQLFLLASKYTTLLHLCILNNLSDHLGMIFNKYRHEYGVVKNITIYQNFLLCGAIFHMQIHPLGLGYADLVLQTL